MKKIENITRADFEAAILPNGIPQGWEFFKFEANEYYQYIKIRRQTDQPGYVDGWEYKTYHLESILHDVYAYLTLKRLGYEIPYDPAPMLLVN